MLPPIRSATSKFLAGAVSVEILLHLGREFARRLRRMSARGIWGAGGGPSPALGEHRKGRRQPVLPVPVWRCRDRRRASTWEVACSCTGGRGGCNRWPATAASTLSDKPRWEKDIEPLVETAALNAGNNCRANPGTARKFARDFRIRRQAAYQDIAFRYRAASKRNIGVNWPKSMEQAREALKKLNVFAEMPELTSQANCRGRFRSNSIRKPR